ncbi:microviridin/marinostatin family tricyclic proteinase inhibitor [Chitinophaga barathri]|uniref:microviridin/marinostatin family tricyclic proteinase inhibitor n=1 Tax=Chitinophaga barathri TaxID=1647451 RepID=UPI0011CDA2B7|nr:microviridin/marinostatin family tricyclic proteinase inhibitor [Chitinophaga barathri]
MQPEVNPVEKPFFAQLLEQQKASEKDPPIFTLKIFDHVEHTTKYPSDGDEV